MNAALISRARRKFERCDFCIFDFLIIFTTHIDPGGLAFRRPDFLTACFTGDIASRQPIAIVEADHGSRQFTASDSFATRKSWPDLTFLTGSWGFISIKTPNQSGIKSLRIAEPSILRAFGLLMHSGAFGDAKSKFCIKIISNRLLPSRFMGMSRVARMIHNEL